MIDLFRRLFLCSFILLFTSTTHQEVLALLASMFFVILFTELQVPINPRARYDLPS